MTNEKSVLQLLQQAIEARADFIDPGHQTAFRLFNGFNEGYPELVLEIYGRTLVAHDYASESGQNKLLVQNVNQHLASVLTWLRAGVLKVRNGRTQEEKKGTLVFGEKPDTTINEYGVSYAIDLTLTRDSSFYLDTRNLRKWLLDNMQGKSVLNTFAYTGSLGVAAMAGGAARVLQHDLNQKFLSLARRSYSLNGFPILNQDFISADFFPTVSGLKRMKQTFDCVILDPPFFSTTSKGKVDQEKESARLINKVRPLIRDDGYLIAINNALYASGKEYMQTLEDLSRDGYLKVEEIIPIPEDCTGYNIVGTPITDPSPFNHSTKIAILKVRRKQP